MNDPVDDAIKAAEAQPPAEVHQSVTVQISSTGRHVILSFPQDLTEAELFEFVGWASNQLRIGLAQERAKRGGGRIILPAGVLPS